MINNFDFTPQIQAGLQWLDENEPGWLDILAEGVEEGIDMEDCDSCIWGYLYGNYWYAPMLRDLGNPSTWPLVDEEGWRRKVAEASRRTAPLGFSVSECGAEEHEDCCCPDLWFDLTDQWIDAIRDRLSRTAPATA